MILGEETNENVACTIHISMAFHIALSTLEFFTPSQFEILHSAVSTCLAGVGLVDLPHMAPWILFGCMHQSHLELVMCPGHHLSCCLAAAQLPCSLVHLGLKRWNEDEGVILTQPLDEFSLQITSDC